jgi:hypothetical protein
MAVLFLTSTAIAQPVWELGAKGGFNDAKFIGDQAALFVNRPGLAVSGQVDDWNEGFVVGAFARRNFSEFVALQVEALYSQKGGEGPVFGTADVQYTGNVTRTADITGVMTISMDYVEIPVFALFSFAAEDNGKVTLTASTGGYVEYNTAAWVEIEGTGTVALPGGTSEVVNFEGWLPPGSWRALVTLWPTAGPTRRARPVSPSDV